MHFDKVETLSERVLGCPQLDLDSNTSELFSVQRENTESFEPHLPLLHIIEKVTACQNKVSSRAYRTYE